MSRCGMTIRWRPSSGCHLPICAMSSGFRRPPPSPCARHVVRSCLAAGFEPIVTFESDDYETIQGLVAAGVGVALIPRLALTRVHRGIIVRALAPRSPARKVIAATTSLPGVTPAAQAMVDVLSDVARRYADDSFPGAL